MKKDKVVKDVVDSVEPIKEEVKEEVKEESKEVKPLINPKWVQLKNEILGKDFEIDASYPDSGSGFRIRVIVPREKSNASESHWGFYKHDIRSKSINDSDGPDGIKNFFMKVAKNLGITQANLKR
jgi:hypothetical protein